MQSTTDSTPSRKMPIAFGIAVGLVVLGLVGSVFIYAYVRKSQPAVASSEEIFVPTPRPVAIAKAEAVKTSNKKVPVEAEAKPPVFQPEPLQKDFGIKISLVEGRLGKDNLAEITEEADLIYEVIVEEDAFVTLWSLNPDGSATQLFPSADKEPSLFKAGDKRLAPVDVVFTASLGSMEPEKIYVLASTQGWRPPVLAKAAGKLLELPGNGEADSWEKLGRAELLQSARKTPGNRLAETIFQYRVTAKAKEAK